MVKKEITNSKLLGITLVSSILTILALMPLRASAADSVIDVSVNGVITAFTTSGTVTLGALTPDATGTQSIANDSVSVTTNDIDGFTLTLEDADTTYTLASGGNSFDPTAGTEVSPATLANGEWGWRVDNLSGFGAGPTTTLNNGSPSSLTFAGIPENGSAFTINSTATTGTDTIDVWYSARANDTQPEGTYTNTVTYTATVNP